MIKQRKPFDLWSEVQLICHQALNSTTTVKEKNIQPKRKRSMRQNIGLILGPILFFVTFFGLSPDGMPTEALAVLASTLWIATWWVTEAIPIPATSLLPIILFPITGAVEDPGIVTPNYGDKNIFLFLGGFIIAIAMENGIYIEELP